MLDWYYLNEKALPLDVTRIARLIRMTGSIDAVQVVLEEFFVKSEDGWHNKRADEELTAMLTKQEQQASKDEHEADRMRRHRERRASMFAALREVQIVPAWDVPMKELQRLFDTHCNVPETHLQREQAVSCNAPATAIPTPTPTPKEEVPSGTSVRPDKPRPPRKHRLPDDFEPSLAGIDSASAKGLDVQAELQKFRDHHAANGSLMADWQAAWRTWVSRAHQFARSPPKHPTLSRAGAATAQNFDEAERLIFGDRAHAAG